MAKIDASGSSLIYSTYLGGSDRDVGRKIAMDTSGNAYIIGYTNSTDFPTAAPIQETNAGDYDIFVTKIDSSGSSLVYSTYLGGSNTEIGTGIAVDISGNAYVTGWTYSTNFPTASPIQGTNAGNNDVFVTKIDASGSSLVYSTYLGGSDTDLGQGIAVDISENAYVTGETRSTEFPTASPIYGTYAGGYYDAFVTKIDTSGSNLVYSTYLGGIHNDYGYGIAVDTSRNAYITGNTLSSDFPISFPIQGTRAGVGDAFVTKINSSGSSLAYSTYLGGVDWDKGAGIAVDTLGNAYVTGWTYSTDFPTASPIQGTNAGGSDAFIAIITDASTPTPDIQANGSNGPVTIYQGDILTITVVLDPGESAGDNADWWIWADSPLGRYWFTPASGWVRSDTPIRGYAGPLVTLGPYTVLDMSTLPVGDYSINFAVDDNMDDVFDATYTDTVDVTIQ